MGKKLIFYAPVNETQEGGTGSMDIPWYSDETFLPLGFLLIK